MQNKFTNLAKMNSKADDPVSPAFSGFKNLLSQNQGQPNFNDRRRANSIDPDRSEGEGYVQGASNTDYREGEFINDLDMNQLRAERQSNFSKTMSGLGRVGVKVLSEVAKMPGMLGGLLAAPFSDDPAIETIFNNAWIRNIEDANQYINNEALPVYIKNSVRDGNIIDNLTSIDFWATEGADGVGYIASMFVPGAALKGLGLGRAMMKGTSKLAMMGSKAASKSGSSMFSIAKKAQNALSKVGATEANMNILNATIANTFFEAGAEAGGAMRNFEDNLKQQLQSGEITQEEFDAKMSSDIKADLGRNIFWANTAILLGPNLITNKILYGAKLGSKGVSSYIDDAGKFISEPGKMLTKKNVGKGVGEFAKGFAREGFWEEAMQSSVESMYSKQAEDGDGSMFGGNVSLVDSYIETLTSVEGQKAIALGGLLGGPMNVYSAYQNKKATEKRRTQLAPHMDNMINLFTMSTDKIFDTDPKTGERTINTKYAEMYGQEIKKIEYLESMHDTLERVKELNGGILNSEQKAIGKRIQNDFIASFIMPFVQNNEMGITILEKALSNNEDIINKIEENNELYDENITKDDFVKSIVEQAKAMQKDYNESSEYLRFMTPIKSDKLQEKREFYDKLVMLDVYTRQRKRFFEENKLSVEKELNELKLEALKEFNLKMEVGQRAYSKYDKTALKPGSDTQVNDLSTSSFDNFMKKAYGFNNQENFFEYYQNEEKNQKFKSKMTELDDMITGILSQNEILEYIYSKDQVQKTFDDRIKEMEEIEEIIETETEVIKEEEEKAKEESEQEIITNDNKEKTKVEKEKKKKEKEETDNEIAVKNKVFKYFQKRIADSNKNIITFEIEESPIYENLLKTNLFNESLRPGNAIKAEKISNDQINITILDGTLKTLDFLEIKFKDIVEEKPVQSSPNIETENTQEDNIPNGKENETIANETLNQESKKVNDSTHAKLVDIEGTSADAAFIAYSETPRDKTGEEVTFELGDPLANKEASKALNEFQDYLNSNKVLTKEKLEYFATYLPIKAVVKNGGKSSLPYSNDKVPMFPASIEIKRNIITNMVNGVESKSTILFQKPGKIQLDRLSDKTPAKNKVFDENGNSNLLGGKKLSETDVLFSNSVNDIVNSSGEIVGAFNKVKNKGQIFISIPMANGRTIPLKLNQRRINKIEADILFKVVKTLTDPSTKIKYKDNLDMLKELTNFTPEEIQYIDNEIKMTNKDPKKINVISFINNFVYEGASEKNLFKLDGSKLLIGNSRISFSDMDENENFIKDWLLTEKNRQINKEASNQASYKKHIFDTILTTDAVIGQPLFSGSTAIYLDPSLGNKPKPHVQTPKEKVEKIIEKKKEEKISKPVSKKQQSGDGTDIKADISMNDLLGSDDFFGTIGTIEVGTKEQNKKQEEKASTLENKTKPRIEIKPGRGRNELLEQIKARKKAIEDAKKEIEDNNKDCIN